MLLTDKVFLSYLNKLTCFENKPHIALGVSGGPDSMALVYLLKKWIKLKKGKLSALIFDHGIRGNSNEEAYQVQVMLKKLNIESFIIKPKKNNPIKKNMAQARSNRFEGLINFCLKNNILHLFLGHHLDDNIETYLIRKINGSNFEGLSSMNTIAYIKNIQIIRPLLKINKLSIINYNNKNKIEYINDPSNKNINYTRVKVRNFLQQKSYKKSVYVDLIYLRNQISDYKRMIWELFFESLVEVNAINVKLDFNKLIKLDKLIIEKHILILLKFLLNKKYPVKSSKISIFIEAIKNPRFKIFNLSGVIINKKSNFLIFSQK